MTVDPGLAILKKNWLVCPFVTMPEQYGMTLTPGINAFCWFKAENMKTEEGWLEPLVVDCPYTADFDSCPIYQTNIPPL